MTDKIDNDIEKEENTEQTQEVKKEPEVQKETPEKNEKDDIKSKKYKKISKTDLEEIVKEIESLQTLVKEKDEKYMRMAAEYDNFRKRSAKEKESIYGDAQVDVIKEILPILDNLERAVSFEGEGEGKLKEGVNMTLNMFKGILEKMEVVEIETDGKTFDPNLHNAVMHIESEEYGENTVVETFSKGYRKGDRVIRYAMVKVAN